MPSAAAVRLARTEPAPIGRSPAAALAEPFPWIAAAAVLLSRATTTGGVYWADGPAHVKAIRSGTYLIQSPGYWLWNHTGGLLPNPELGLDLFNWLFSALSILVFYGLARELLSRTTARLATICYGTIFFAWFSGTVQSSYASQLFFPCAVAWLLVRREREGRRSLLWAAAAVYAIGAGFRPSDGVFLGPMVLWWLSRERLRDAAAACAVIAGVAALWVVPTLLAMHQRGGVGGSATYTGEILGAVSVFSGRWWRWLGNVTRYVFPFTMALWPLAFGFVRGVRRLSRDTAFLLIWIVPGTLFFLFVFMSDATYLNHLLAPVILIAAMGLEASRNRWALPTCAAWNAAFFLFATPLSHGGFPAQVVNAIAVKYTRYGVTHQYWPNLSSLVDRGD